MYPERMLENLDARYGLVFSQPVLLALVEAGQVARRRVPDRAAQRDADVGGAPPVHRRARARTPSVTAALDDAQLDRVLRPRQGALANIGRTFDGPRRHDGDLRCRRPCCALYSGKVRDLYDAGRRPAAHGRVGPGLGLRRRAAEPDPRQGAGAHRACRPSGSSAPPTSRPTTSSRCDPADFPASAGPDAAAGRCSCAARRRSDRVHRTRVPVRQRRGRSTGSAARSRAGRCPPACARPRRSPSRCSPRPPRPTPATTCR